MKMFLLLSFSVLLGMCSKAPANFEGGYDVSQDKDVSVEVTMTDLNVSPEEERSVALPPAVELSASTPVTQRKLICTANLTVEVNNYNKAREELEKIFTTFNAQVSQESEQRQSYRIENNLIIRVRPERLDSLILAIEQIAAEIDSKTITSEDVTRQYVDLESRLATKRAVIAQYRELLKGAKTTTAILEVSDKLNEVIEEVESTEAQLRVLRDQVQQSTLNLNMYQTFSNIAARHEGFGSRLGDALAGGWQGLLNVLVGLIYAWPLVLTIGMVLFFILRARKKGKTFKNVGE